MADTHVLRSTAIVANASLGASKPPSLETGALPLVQVKMVPGGPQVQEGQQRPMTILAPNSKGAVTTGELPMVQVKMTQNGPRPDDGQDRPVLIRDGKPTIAAGELPMVQVKMTSGGPQVQNAPTPQSTPPLLQGAPPILSVLRTAAQGGRRVERVAAPQAALPAPQPLPEFDHEQLMLFRHLAVVELVALRDAIVASADPSASAEDRDQLLGEAEQAAAATDNGKILVSAIDRIDAMFLVIAARLDAVKNGGAVAHVAPAVGSQLAPSQPAPRTVGYVVPTAGHPGIRTGTGPARITAGPVAVPQVTGVRSQRNAGMAPRRVTRPVGRPTPPADPHPPVVVQMNGNRPIVQDPPAPAATPAPAETPVVVDVPAADVQV